MRVLLLLAVALTAAVLPAQTVLMGFANPNCPVTPGPPVGAVATQKLCTTPDWCMTSQTPPMGLPAMPWGGAATWDQGLYPEASWVSEGRNIRVYYPVPGGSNPCQQPCKMVCTVPWTYRTYVTGMAIDPIKRRLFISDDSNTIYTYQVLSPCKIQLRSQCRISLPIGTYITGLGYDKFNHGTHGDLLFICSGAWQPGSNPPPPVVGSTMIYVSPASSPCRPFCKYPLPACGTYRFGPATGLTVDACRQKIFVTDGPMTAILAYKYPCSFKVLGCCPAKPIHWYGLGLRRSECAPFFGLSGSTTTARHPCKLPPAVPCAFTPGYSGGEPYVGNPQFQLRFVSGPNPIGYAHAGLLMLNLAGNCQAQTLVMPCKERIILYPVMDTFFFSTLVPVTPGLTQPCGLTGQLPLPIPPNPALCCHKFCGQWAVLNLLTTGPGTWRVSLSRQFSVTIGG